MTKELDLEALERNENYREAKEIADDPWTYGAAIAATIEEVLAERDALIKRVRELEKSGRILVAANTRHFDEAREWMRVAKDAEAHIAQLERVHEAALPIGRGGYCSSRNPKDWVKIGVYRCGKCAICRLEAVLADLEEK